jgi:hypothetical protein
LSLRFRFQREGSVDLAASPQAVFAFLDNLRRLSAHWEKPSLILKKRLANRQAFRHVHGRLLLSALAPESDSINGQPTLPRTD